MRENNTLYWLLTDHLGSTNVTLDANGNRVTELRYYPYGNVRYNPGGQVTTYRFTGQRWDSGTGLYWYQSRWYDPIIGRFVQPDPIVPNFTDPQALNRYSYVRNNPLRYTDPAGHWWETALDVIFTAWDIGDLLTEPSWEKVGTVALDVLFIAAPLPNVVAGVKRVGPAAETLQKLNRLRELAGHVRGVETLGKALSPPFGGSELGRPSSWSGHCTTPKRGCLRGSRYLPTLTRGGAL